MTEHLTKEIIKTIFSDLGLFNNIGLTSPLLKNDLEIILEYDDGIQISHSIWAGEIALQDAKFRAIVVDLTSADYKEFGLVFQLDRCPVYGIRLSLTEEDNGLFKLSSSDGKWINASTIVKAGALIGIEQIVSLGLMWRPCLEIKDLYDGLSNLCLM